jgi:hypothetical protein
MPVLLAFGFGLFFWLQYFIPAKWSNDALTTFNASWTIIIVTAALVLGVMSAVHYHATKIRRKRQGWAYSIITLCAFVITACIGLISKIGTREIQWPGFPDNAVGDLSPFMWIFTYIFNPLDATLFALLAFFIASAAFRAFRARSPEATLLLLTGIIVMLGRVPAGAFIHVWSGLNGEGQPYSLADISQWILNFPSTAAQRGILFGVVLSQIAIALRIIFGIERTYMGGGED